MQSKQENHNLRVKTAIKIRFEISRKRKHSLIAETVEVLLYTSWPNYKKIGGKVQWAIIYLNTKFS